MRTTTLTPCSHIDRLTGPVRLLTDKVLWIRVNRIVAWALVTSPAVQIAMGTRLLHGLLLDLALLVLHGLLSLWLYGRPKAAVDQRWKLWLGLRPRGLTPRGRFLLAPWRLLLGLAWMPVSFLAGRVLGPWVLLLVLPAVPLWLLQPFFVLGHTTDASEYAFKRWGMTGEGNAWVTAVVVTAMFAISSSINLFR